MAGVWWFIEGVATLVPNPHGGAGAASGRRKVLVYRPTNQIVSSYAELEQRLHAIGWSRYPNEQAGSIQFHRAHSSPDLITLPRDVRCLRPMHLLDIAMKNRTYFEVRDQQ